jgi:hypothetical protein
VKRDRRRERVARINAKRPPIVVEVVYEPDAGAQEKLAELLFELIDPLIERK